MLASTSSQNTAVVQLGCSRKTTTSEIGLWFIGRTSLCSPSPPRSYRRALSLAARRQFAPGTCSGRYDVQRGGTTVGLALFEITLADRHLVGDMGKAQDRFAAGLGECIEACRLHFDREDVACAAALDGGGRLAEGCINRPAGASVNRLRYGPEGVHRGLDEPFSGVDEICRRQVVVARALIAQSPVDQDEIGRRSPLNELAGRSHADQKPAARDKQLLGEQHGVGGADGAADDPEAFSRMLEFIEIRVVARPFGRAAGPPGFD